MALVVRPVEALSRGYSEAGPDSGPALGLHDNIWIGCGPVSTMAATPEKVGFIDGSWIDLATFGVAMAYAFVKYWRKNETQKLVSKATALDVLHGIALFPLMLMAGAAFSSTLLDALLHTHKVILSAAGLVALFAILEGN